jgi:cell wall-associated NlpC family hydrolase
MEPCPICARLPGALEDLVGWRHFHTSAPCWEFCRQVYARHLGLQLAPENLLERRCRWHRLVDRHRHEWERTAAPQVYDLVLILQRRQFDHLGLYAGAGAVLHAPSLVAGVTRTTLEALRIAGWTVETYRYRGRTTIEITMEQPA